MDNLTANIVAALLAVNLCYLKFKQAVVYKDSNTCFNVACKIGIVYGGSLFVTPDKSEILGLLFLFNVGRRMTQKNPQTEWSGDVVEHCQQKSNLYAGISLLRSVRFKPRNGGTSARFNPCSCAFLS